MNTSDSLLNDLMQLDLQSLPQEQISLPEIIGAQQLLESDVCEPPEIVEGLFRKGEKVLIGGRSKAMKTWAAMNLAISVSHGRNFWGFKTQEGECLYINFELHPGTVKNRLRMIAHAMDVFKFSPNLEILNLRGFHVTAQTLLNHIVKQSNNKHYAVIIIDPLYKLTAGKDENSAGEMTVVMNAIEEISKTTGAAIVIPAHFSKGDASKKDSIDRISGSGVFARDADTIITMVALEHENTYLIESNLRSLPPINPITVRWEFPIHKVDPSIDKTKIKPAKSGRPPKYTVEQIVEVLANEKLKSKEWQAKCEMSIGIGSSRFNDLKNIAKAKKLVVHIGGYFQKSTSNNSDNPELNIRTSSGSGNSDNPITL